MKCPKCGNEIGEGKLLCENCGAEVNIVPDFDIELEAQLSESITSMVEELTDDATEGEEGLYVDDFDGDDDIKSELSDYLPISMLRLLKNYKIFVVIVFVMLVVGISAIALKSSNNDKINSYEYQYEQAIACAAENNYADAVYYLERALAVNSEDLDAWLLLAKYYDQNGQNQSTVSLLNELLKTDEEYSRRDEVYDTLLSIYEEQGKYEDMEELLKTCSIQRITSKYNKYMAIEPQFNKLGGDYDELISITLSGNTQGFVYYTLDGSAPTSSSMVYETPILLEAGKYTIKAMFVNMYGVHSGIVTQNYNIRLSVPAAPEINLDSGTYNEPALIEVYHNNDTKIYYTTDGTMPTKNSSRYTGPIEMPYDVSNFAFIAFDEAGLSSVVVNRTYQLNLQSNISTDFALRVLLDNLIAIGKLSDLEGHIPNKQGLNRYRVQTVARINESLCYIIYEEYVDDTGNFHDTSNIFAVDSNTAALFRAYKVNEGVYNLLNFDNSITPNAEDVIIDENPDEIADEVNDEVTE